MIEKKVNQTLVAIFWFTPESKKQIKRLAAVKLQALCFIGAPEEIRTPYPLVRS